MVKGLSIMKHLILILSLLFSFNVLSENYHQFSAKYRFSEENTISHLPIKHSYGVQFDFRRDLGAIFYEGNLYVLQSSLSNSTGFNIGAGVKFKQSSLSVNYFGESNYEKWRIKEGNCKACNLDWINSNYRSHYTVKYQYTFENFNPFIEYHHVKHDRDELLNDRLFAGFKINTNAFDKDLFLSVKSDLNLTSVNVGFKY